jgi:hypothetical protein
MTRKPPGRTLRLALLLFALPYTPSANAQVYYAIGEANQSCGEFVQAIEAEKKARRPTALPTQIFDRAFLVFVGVTDGYLTSANMSDPANRTVGGHSEIWGRMTWLENYCRDNPLVGFPNALLHVRDYMSAHKQ